MYKGKGKCCQRGFKFIPRKGELTKKRNTKIAKIESSKERKGQKQLKGQKVKQPSIYKGETAIHI
jgi:hypothetical protein